MARRALMCVLAVCVALGVSVVSAVATPAARPAAARVAAATVPPGLVSLPPARVLDTRTGLGAPKGTVGAGRSIDLTVAGRGGLPTSGVGAVMLNLTVTVPKGAGYATAYPSGVTRPTASTLNFVAGQTVANQAFVKVGTSGKVTLFVSAATHLVVDVTAYYPTGAAYTPLTPTRILDTRSGLGVDTSVNAFARKVKVAGVAGVPSTGVGAVVLNVTALGQIERGYVTTWPFGAEESDTSFMNYAPGATNFTLGAPTAGMTVAKVGVGGAIWLYADRAPHLVADVVGWYPASGSDYVPVGKHARLVDTRAGLGVSQGPVAAGGTLNLSVAGSAGVPAADAAQPATAVEVTVTAVNPAAAGYLTAYPAGTRPTASTINYARGTTRANSATLQLPASGGLSIHTSSRTDVVVDVVGYFVRSAPVGTIDGQTIEQISAGGQHTCAVLSGGGASCWGDNARGELGDGTFTDRFAPVSVQYLSGTVTSVSAGANHTCAVLTDGRVECWGLNSSGQLGDGTTTTRGNPTGVRDISAVSALAAGGRHTCALTQGNAVCWGANEHGQLGQGTGDDTVDTTTLPRLGGRISAISAGFSHTCVVVYGGVWCWGANERGQLGNGTTTDSDRPIRVSGLDGQGDQVVSISAGSAHTCAALETGAVQCWGANDRIQLGRDNSITDSSTPVTVSSLPQDVMSVAAGDSHTCAMFHGGEVACWGQGSEGQLGNGATASRSGPVLVTDLSGATAIVSGGNHSCAVLDTGIAKCWGWNVYGELADGTHAVRSVPVIVNDLRNSTDGAPYY